MKKGFDTAQPVAHSVACLKTQGYDFIVRYYNVNNLSKNLTPAEAAAICNAGMQIVAVWENDYPESAGYFSYEVGRNDGLKAYNQGQNVIGQPGATPIYFAVDYDAKPSEIANNIIPYFKGVADAFNSLSSNLPLYAIGAYGSGLVCSTLLANNLVIYTWLALSMGFAGSKTFANYNIKQFNQITTCGITGDPDQSPNDNQGLFITGVGALA